MICTSSGVPLVKKQRKKEAPKTGRKEIDERRSKYIGVSRNGDKWQALLLVGKRKLYLGTLEDEEETALLHDLNSLLYNGIKKVRVAHDTI